MLFCVHALGLLCHGIFKSPGNRRRKIRRRKTDCFCNYLIIVLIYYINNINFYSISALNTLEISSKYFTPFKIELQISKTMRKWTLVNWEEDRKGKNAPELRNDKTKTWFLYNLNSHAGGWSWWSPYHIKSIFRHYSHFNLNTFISEKSKDMVN